MSSITSNNNYKGSTSDVDFVSSHIIKGKDSSDFEYVVDPEEL